MEAMPEHQEPTGAYTVALPEGWGWQLARASVVIFRVENGVGALNLSTILANANAPLRASSVLAASLNDRLPGVVRTHVPRGDGVDVSLAEYARGDVWWRKWVLVLGNRIVHATYNCRIGARGREDESVSRIVASIRLSNTG